MSEPLKCLRCGAEMIKQDSNITRAESSGEEAMTPHLNLLQKICLVLFGEVWINGIRYFVCPIHGATKSNFPDMFPFACEKCIKEWEAKP